MSTATIFAHTIIISYLVYWDRALIGLHASNLTLL